MIAIYLRNTIRFAGLLAVALGGILAVYHAWGTLHGDTTSVFYLSSPASVNYWLSHAAPLIQGLLGLPWVILMEVPLALLLLVGGILAMRV